MQWKEKHSWGSWCKKNGITHGVDDAPAIIGKTYKTWWREGVLHRNRRGFPAYLRKTESFISADFYERGVFLYRREFRLW